MAKFLIVDDDRTVLKGISFMLEEEGRSVLTASNRKTAERILEREEMDIVVSDLYVPTKEDGLSVVRFAKARSPFTQVLVVTAFGSIENAVEAMKAGADNFIVKGFKSEELKITVKKLEEARLKELESERLKHAAKSIQDDFELREHYDQFIGESQVMKELWHKIEQVAVSNFSACLVEGETGTGKELVARAIHRLSPRRGKPFIAVNCAALPHDLIEGELFGHEKGAFTGADKIQPGRFELANGGTVFLDEVAEISLDVQAKFLRILEEKELYRIGGQKPIPIDTAIIAATNRDLKKAVEAAKFRKDIFYRLASVRLKAPPLREHSEDIPLLANYFLEKFNRAKRMRKAISPEALEGLRDYHFPGNVRELKNLIENAMTFSQSDVITLEGLAGGLAAGSKVSSKKEYVERIKETLAKHKGNITHAAEELGLTREGLTRKLKKLGLK
jgi:two-component system NtrC family response regulator